MAALTSLLVGGAVLGGLGLGVAGMQQQRQAAQEQSAYQQQMIQQQQHQEELRRRAMELDARRRSLESIRAMQRSRAQALTTTTAQGASMGSALPGAYGQFSGAAGNTLLGISQGLELGRENFASNSMISQARMGYAQAGADMMSGAALSSLGGMLVSNAGTIGNLGTTAFKGNWMPGVFRGSGFTGNPSQWG